MTALTGSLPFPAEGVGLLIAGAGPLAAGKAVSV